MKLPLDVILIIVDIISHDAVRRYDLGVFLTLAKVSRMFKHVMYNKSIRRMFLAMHASKAKQYTTWDKVGPRVNQLMSNPLVYFDDDVIIKLCSEFVSSGQKNHVEAMKRFFGHRGAVEQENIPIIGYFEYRNFDLYFNHKSCRVWKIPGYIIVMIQNPLISFHKSNQKKYRKMFLEIESDE